MRAISGFLAACALSTLMVGCASESLRLEELSFDDAAVASRGYVGVDRAQVVEAVHKVLWLSGYGVFPTPDGVIGALDEPVYLEGDAPPPFWTVSAMVEDDRVLVRALVRKHYGGPAYGRDSPAQTLFFERVDYLLELNPQWTTCAQALERWPGEKRFEGVLILCFLSKSFRGKIPVEPDPDQHIPHTTPTPDQWLALTTRRYEHLTPADVLKAAKEVLTRSQAKFEYLDLADGFVGRVTHRRFLYVVFAGGETYETHFWEVRARVVDGVTQVNIYATTEESSTGATMIGGGSFHRMPGPPHIPDRGAGVYGLFWGRLDHALGLSPHWPTCEEAKGQRWLSSPDPICF